MDLFPLFILLMHQVHYCNYVEFVQQCLNVKLTTKQIDWDNSYILNVKETLEKKEGETNHKLIFINMSVSSAFLWFFIIDFN